MTDSAASGPMPSAVLAALVVGLVVAGGLLGAATATRLRSAGYRLDDERGPSPRWWWWPALALPAVWLWSTWLVGPTSAWPVLPAHLLMGWLTVVLSWVDLDVHRLPDGIVLPAYPALAVLLVLAGLADPGRGHGWALIGALVLVLGFGAVALAVPAWMGLGDVKVVGLVGMLLGWWGPGTLVLGVMAGLLLGGLHASIVLVTGRGGRHAEIAYGPSLLVGAVLIAGAGSQILTVAPGP